MDRDEYLRRAEDYERLAKLLTDQAQQNILRIAAGWRDLASASEPKARSAAYPFSASPSRAPPLETDGQE
jgi:hypothetical protein